MVSKYGITYIMKLNLIYSDKFINSNNSISVNFILQGNQLNIQFEVHTTQKIYVNTEFKDDRSTWGLWEYDVVEVFIAKNNSVPYFEFNVSPINQYFELEIIEPRIKVNRNFKSGFNHKAETTKFGWTAELTLPLESLGFKSGDEIYGNAFACLGDKTNREYWSLFLPKQDQPDFHIPKYFKKLL